MLAKSETVSAVLRAKPDIADQRAEAGAIARDMTVLFQIIFFLRPVGGRHRDDLVDRSWSCARAIAVPEEQLLLTLAPPIARGFAGQPLQGKLPKFSGVHQTDDKAKRWRSAPGIAVRAQGVVDYH